MSQTLKQASAETWTVAPEGDKPTLEHINAGSLQRIAAATEKMAVRHTELIADRDRYKRWYDDAVSSRDLAKRQLSAAKGQVTKLRKQLADVRAAAALEAKETLCET